MNIRNGLVWGGDGRGEKEIKEGGCRVMRMHYAHVWNCQRTNFNDGKSLKAFEN